MPRPEQRLYSELLRIGRRFQAERLPLLGVAGSPLVAADLQWGATLRAAVEAPPVPGAGLAEGVWLLTQLNRQLDTLLQAEAHTREGLAEWAGLVERYGGGWGTHRRHSSSGGSSSSISAATSSGDGDGDGMPPGLPFAAAAAVEEGLALLSRQAQELADPLSFLEQEAGSGGSSSSSGCDDGQAPVTLDQLAAVVRRQHPRLFPLSPGATSSSSGGVDRPSGGGSSGEAQLAQAEALAGVLYRQHRFRFEPFEWVYEGLEPLLLPPSGALHRRKLAPLTLAAAAAGAGRRLGLPLLPVPAEPGEVIAAAVAEGPAGGAAAGGLPLDQLRPEVAQRYAGRAGAAPPTAGPWVLLLGGGDSAAAAAAGGQQEQWAHALDASTGRLMDAAELRQRHPQLQLAVDWHRRAPLVAWQHMIRTVIQAHQRRGESDLVAHWVYVLLAMDTQAEEWDHMLAPSALHA
ncbi:hypothetical protein C2E20_2328 [Micractinium conductrix]|uniref:Uncharacterized protein n=1 Tax=Micractinium conductrix TaxID=554055 RepID=A0A2P6VK39_9CHLO|nr:hypothetical protein C2E20_2328 [Micractinium conductrix]|eukprot:PSC74455.1 hypothetical protein C2E20_2328 [Micractinium conductrix]